MTDEVAALVLRNNHLQTLCLSLGVARGDEELGYDARLMRHLEARGLLDRRLEGCPTMLRSRSMRPRGEA
jgi:glutamate dehydrogenase